MAQVRIVPSSYQLSNTSYLTISNASNMYTNVDSTTYAQVNHTRTQTTAYYVYVRGFNFSQVPTGAIINSITVKIKANVTSASTTQKPALYNGTTAISGAPTFGTNIGSSVTTSQATITTSQWETYKGYGSNFGIRLYLNRSNRNTASNMKIYGAELLVDYTLPTYYTVSTSLTGSGTISPSGSTSILEGESQTITITPTDKTATVTATDNGVAVTLTTHMSETSASSVIKNYAIVSGSFSSGATSFSNAVNKGYDTTSATTSNGYASSGNTVVVRYTFDFSSVPSNATITSVRCRIKGHAESTSNSNEHCDCQLYANNTAKGSMKSFKGQGTTSPNVMELDDCGTWTRSELDNLQLRVTVGYYGGAIDGATIDVEYSTGVSEIEYYTYEITNITANHTFVATIGTPSGTYNIKLGTITIEKIFLQTTAVKKVYLGTTLVYSNGS